MKNMTILKRAASLVGLTLGAFALSVAAASSWTPPSSTPPTPNADAPLNVGGSQQSKLGPLYINTGSSSQNTIGLQVFGQSNLFGKLTLSQPAGGSGALLQIIDGNQADGKVLTSDGSGNISWQSPSGQSLSLGSCVRSGSYIDVSTGDEHDFKCPANQTMCGMSIAHNYPNNENKIYAGIYCAPLSLTSALSGVTCSLTRGSNAYTYTINIATSGGSPTGTTLQKSINGGTWTTTSDGASLNVYSQGKGTYSVSVRATEGSNTFTGSCGSFVYQ